MSRKATVCMLMDNDLHDAGMAYAAERKISFSRLVHEALCALLGVGGAIDPEVRKGVEERIVRAPGRAPMSAQQIVERRAEAKALKKKREAEFAAAMLEKIREQNGPGEE